MRPTNKLYTASNTEVKERYEISKKAIADCLIEIGSQQNKNNYHRYFKKVGSFMMAMMAHNEAIKMPTYYEDKDFDTLLQINHDLYADISSAHYATSFVNPTYACAVFGLEMGRFLSGFNFIIRQFVGFAYEDRRYDMMVYNELFLRLYERILLKKEEEVKTLSLMMRDHLLNHASVLEEHYWIRLVSPEFDTYAHIIRDYNHEDLRYLFRYGMYVGTNEIESAKQILSMEEEKIDLIANTFSEAFMRGYQREKKIFDHKKSILLTYHLGFERIIKKASDNFKKLGLKPIVQYELKGAQRPRLCNTKPNEQMEYDHRFSNAIYMDGVYLDAIYKIKKDIFEKYKEKARVYAGLALMEVFGNLPFEPKNHEANMTYDKKMTELVSKHTVAVKNLQGKYLPGSSYSFTINDYPLPSIGKDYKAIFEATIKVNTLDPKMYEDIQQAIIDALDQTEYVVVKGAGQNRTDMKVQLMPLADPKTQTKFDNCTADVNVPVGEVYTTPVLSGTEGLLHVKDIYLTGLRYKDLKLWFKEGMVVKYACKNFETKEENLKYIEETLLYPHTTLPLGEFAIGTNTVAYMMAKKYNIHALLPILIGEKAGPHFAIGDTCFVWGEDQQVYNPDGKEMIARENEKTKLRNTKVEEAYTYRHTDITIPYDELDTIIGYTNDGIAYPIIQGGRFVLKGTEALNQPFDDKDHV
ncbi:aminopeptidase [Petrocella sp. FN5]|uniref:aminopeptidase n=1 Tax=Petrocella sp. FN5 TaxID=3032002 RepID=UPI0023DA1ACD|nr:aminopeptidase [Petrocella sp. FN5]MDF1617063.1 aminopeptidase [Petrocella sp. FN5]